MTDTLREAQKQFFDVHLLLNSDSHQDNTYFTNLSIATEEAYVVMNEGMCASNSVCQECAEHRDFIRTMLEVLGSLEIDHTQVDGYRDKLAEYTDRVNKILHNISKALTA